MIVCKSDVPELQQTIELTELSGMYSELNRVNIVEGNTAPQIVNPQIGNSLARTGIFEIKIGLQWLETNNPKAFAAVISKRLNPTEHKP